MCLAALCGCNGSDAFVEADAEKAKIRLSAMDALTAQGANVTSEKLPVVGLEASVVDLSGVKNITDETLTLLKQMHTSWKPLYKINLSGTNITDEQMARLNAKEVSTAVTKLDLRNTGISDKGLQEIKNMPTLSELDLTNTKVTAEGIQAFLKSRADNPDIASKKPIIKR
ncbi:MAG: hypothetical protein ACT4QC_15135 [Planctomycetaceae bacterium]